MFKKSLASILFAGLVALISFGSLKAFAADESDMNHSQDTSRSIQPRWHHADGNYVAEKVVVYVKEATDPSTSEKCDQIFLSHYLYQPADEIQLTFSCKTGHRNKLEPTWGPMFSVGTVMDTDGDGTAETRLQKESWGVFYAEENTPSTSTGDHPCINGGGCHLAVVLIGDSLNPVDVATYVSAHPHEIQLTNPTFPASDRMPVFNFGYHNSANIMQLAFVRFMDKDSFTQTPNSQIYTKQLRKLGYSEIPAEHNMTYRHSGEICGLASNFPEYDFTTPDFSLDGHDVVFSVKKDGHWQIGTMSNLESNELPAAGTTHYSCAMYTYSEYVAAGVAAAAPASSLEIWTDSLTGDNESPHFSPGDYFADANYGYPGILFHHTTVNSSGETHYMLQGFTVDRRDFAGDFRFQMINWYGSVTQFKFFQSPSGTHYDLTDRRYIQFAPAETTIGGGADKTKTFWVAYERLDSAKYWQIFGMRVLLPYSPVSVAAVGHVAGAGVGAISVANAAAAIAAANGTAGLATNGGLPGAGFDFGSLSTGTAKKTPRITITKPTYPFHNSAAKAVSPYTNPKIIPDLNVAGVMNLVDTDQQVNIPLDFVQSTSPELSTKSFIDQFVAKVGAVNSGYKAVQVPLGLNMKGASLGNVTLSYKGDSLDAVENLMLVTLSRSISLASIASIINGGKFEPGLEAILVRPRAYVEFQWTKCPNHHFRPEFNNAGLNDDVASPAKWPPDLAYGMLYHPVSAWVSTTPNIRIPSDDHRIMYLFDLPAPPHYKCELLGCDDKAGYTVYNTTGSYTGTAFNRADDADGDRIPDACDACPTDATNAASPYNGGFLFDVDGNSSYTDIGVDACTQTTDCTDTLPVVSYADTDGDGINDYSTTADADGDGTANACDPCPYTKDNSYYLGDDGTTIICGEPSSCCSCSCCGDSGDTTNNTYNYYYGDTYVDTSVVQTATCTLEADGSALTSGDDSDADGYRDADLTDSSGGTVVCDICPGTYNPNQDSADVNDSTGSGVANGTIDECEGIVSSEAVTCSVDTTTTSLTATVNDLLWFRDAKVDVSFTLSTGTSYVKGSDGYFWALDSDGNRTGSYLNVSLDVVKSAYDAAVSGSSATTAISATSCPVALNVTGGLQAGGAGCGCDMTHVQPLNAGRLITGIFAVLLFTIPLVMLRRRAIVIKE